MNNQQPSHKGPSDKGACDKGVSHGDGETPSVNPATRQGNGNGRQASVLLNTFLQQHSALKRFVSRYFHNAHDIEDVVQEAFLRAFAAGQKDDIRQPKSFLFRIAKNVAVSELRLKSRQITDCIDDHEGSDVLLGEVSVEDEVMARQKLGIHCEAVSTLPPQCRKVYLMRKVYGMSHDEIAERLGVAASTVRNQLMKGVELCDRYVRERMAEHRPQDGKAPQPTPRDQQTGGQG